ncbi:MAG: hypothetical protein J6O56_03270 [Bacilli bacterium]|nr:hypothetical protein [Bacilli bacterium]
MSIIIAGFATCGKSVLGRKYSNIKDLESSPFKNIMNDDIPVEEQKGTKRELNPLWPQNYYDAIIEATRQYDIVLVQLKPEHFDYFDKNNMKYSIAYPNINNWNEVEKRCIERGNNENFIKRLKEVFIPFYEDSIKRKYDKLYILNGKETLEDVLKKDGII